MKRPFLSVCAPLVLLALGAVALFSQTIPYRSMTIDMKDQREQYQLTVYRGEAASIEVIAKNGDDYMTQASNYLWYIWYGRNKWTATNSLTGVGAVSSVVFTATSASFTTPTGPLGWYSEVSTVPLTNTPVYTTIADQSNASASPYTYAGIPSINVYQTFTPSTAGVITSIRFYSATATGVYSIHEGAGTLGAILATGTLSNADSISVATPNITVAADAVYTIRIQSSTSAFKYSTGNSYTRGVFWPDSGLDLLFTQDVSYVSSYTNIPSDAYRVYARGKLVVLP